VAITSVGVLDNFLEGPFGSDKSLQYNSNGLWAGASNLYWDNNNARLGIGTSTPAMTLTVVGNINTYSNGSIYLGDQTINGAASLNFVSSNSNTN